MQSGLEIQALWFEDGGGIQRKDGRRIVTHNEYHGDYDLDWALVMDGDKEISRYNLIFVAVIEWV